MNHATMDLDPLSTYEYPAYDAYLHNNQPYPYQVKLEESLYYNNINPYISPPVPQTPITDNQVPSNDAESKPDVKKKKSKAFCSEKINDASFPFYGCSVCNISYTSLSELDQHVTIHKNRMTSYRLRLRNQHKKKLLKKEKRKLKKLKKIKKETEFDVEIKPEDGYIGNEKAADFKDTDSSNNGNTEANNGVSNLENVSNDKGDSLTDSKAAENTNNKDTTDVNNEKCIDNGKSDSKVNDNDMDETEMNLLEKIYKCFACQKQFTLSYYLKLHVRSHTDEKPYTCNVCNQKFITASKLGRHNKRIHLAARFQCRICFKIYSRFELLTAHFDKNHPEDKLEGEPYDYNAILPYLKELEEQLKEQNDNKEDKKELWPEFELPVKEENQDPPELPKVDILVEEVKVDGFEAEVKVKEEVNDAFEVPELADDCRDDDDNVKNEDDSDEDYFPSNTWAATPKCESPPPSPKRKKPSKFKPTTCEICNKEISSASYMKVHMRTHTGERPYKCYACGRGFITSSKMNRHVLTHGNDVKSEDADNIKLENGDVKSENNVEATEVTEEGVKPKKKRKLKKKLSKELNGDEKIRKKHQKRPHACEFCNQKFLHLNMLEVHKKCHEGEALVYKCQYCLEEAPDAETLREHEATHGGPKPYLCTICGKSYKKRETMVYHRKHHQSDQEHVCEVCSKRFNASCKLVKHLRTHARDKYVLRYECPVCAHMFHTQYHVQMHLHTHQKEGLIQESNRSEVLAMVLQNALKIPKQPDAASTLSDMTPSDERYRICKICGEMFHHFYYLEEHLKSHGSKIAIDDTNKVEEKKYICEICNKGFKLHYYLKLHSFTHSKEKPFICQQCGKGFITKGKLKRHLETHSGVKKYQCHLCHKFFTRPSYLRIHIRTIHGTQDFNFRYNKNLLVDMSISNLSDSQASVGTC